jgi:nitrogen fixation NifU-like protein
MEDPLYKEIILENYQNPQNYGKVKNPDFKVKGFNPVCGDTIALTGKIKNGILSDVKFESEGCAISKASASLLTEKIKGMKKSDILKLSDDAALGMLPVDIVATRHNCALLCFRTLKRKLD